MPVLNDYHEFEGRHWETGTVRNYYAYLGVKAPHTRQPYSEAMLMGVSGGAVMGYFTFAYEGYDPHVRILTRNTFDPLDTLLERLGILQKLQQTSNPTTGVKNLVMNLESGRPVIVWADMWSLPYNALPFDPGMWAAFPILVYGYDEKNGQVWIADRARIPLTVTPAELAAARGRVKANKFRVLTLEAPIEDKLPGAVKKGIWDCIRLYTEAPPKGSRNNFGLAAYRWWAEQLSNPRARMSWEKEFPAGVKMYSGLTNAFQDIMIFGKEGSAERDVFADFLDEASLVLGEPALTEVAAGFRRSAVAWNALAQALLPDEVPLLGEARRLMLRRHRFFLEQGNAGREEMLQADQRLDEIRKMVSVEFPLNASQVAAFRENLCAQILAIHAIEKECVEALQQAMV